MGFDDLEAAEQNRADREDTASERADEPTEPEREDSQAHSSVSEDTTDAATSGEDTGADATSEGPAFEYDDVKQAPMYARPEAWTALEDALDLDVVRSLREAGVRDEEKRELHDAVLRVAADHPDEIADAVCEARREN